MRFSPGHDIPPPGKGLRGFPLLDLTERMDVAIDRAIQRVALRTKWRTAKAQTEIREMAISARRSIGQRIRHAKKAIKQARVAR